MVSKDLEELEKNLFIKVNEQKRIVDRMYLIINDRNRSRITEQQNKSQASALRKRIIVIGILAVGAMVAFFYYQATFGMF